MFREQIVWKLNNTQAVKEKEKGRFFFLERKDIIATWAIKKWRARPGRCWIEETPIYKNNNKKRQNITHKGKVKLGVFLPCFSPTGFFYIAVVSSALIETTLFFGTTWFCYFMGNLFRSKDEMLFFWPFFNRSNYFLIYLFEIKFFFNELFYIFFFVVQTIFKNRMYLYHFIFFWLNSQV